MKICLATLALIAGLHYTASATTFIVNSPNDPGDGIITPSETTLREAIDAAVGGDTIRINPGLTINLTAGELIITNDITIEGTGPNLVTVNGAGASRVFNINGSAVTMSGLRITGGLADNGAGIAVTIAGDQPPFRFAQGHLVLSNSVVANNHASGEGGGIWIENEFTVFGNFTGTLIISNCAIANNTANLGGGIFNRGVVDADVCFVAGNFATNGGGGYMTQGLVVAPSSFVPVNVITRSTFATNRTDGSGGGIATSDGNITLENVTISSNSANANGGGLYNFGADPRPGHANATLNDVTITGNVADADHDSVGDGGGVFNAKVVTAQNTIIAGNFDNGGVSAPDFAGILTSLDYNLIGNTSGTTFSGPTAHTIVGVDPLLGPLALNGFIIPTHALLSGSPAIDTANPATSLPIDERGVTRPQGAGPDIGAYERVLVTPPVIESITATPSVLWPPNHKLVPVTISVQTEGELVSCVILGAFSNQPVNGTGDGNTSPDIVRTGDLSLLLRAERAGNIKTDRVYTVTVLCADTFGNTTRTNVYVTVPHDQGK